MATVYSDWIGESTPTTGTGNIVLGGSLQGFSPMSSAGIGQIYYTIVDGHNKETGLGTYDGATGFARTTVIATLIDNVHTPNSAPLNLSGSAQIYGTVNSGTMKAIFNKLTEIDTDFTDVYTYIDQQISIVNQTITALDTQINNKVDNLGPDDVGAYPRTGGDLTGKATFKNSDSGIHIDGGTAAIGTAGDFRYNPTLGVFEGYFNGKWRNVGGGTGVTWAPTATSISPAEVGKGYLINAAGLTITLPATPEAGNSIGIGDYQGKNFTATVARNGKPIMGIAEDFTFDVKNASIVFSFVDNTIGWVLTQGFGENNSAVSIINKSRFTNVAGQATFSFPNFGIDTVDVYYNGFKLDRVTDYSANNTADTVTLTVAVTSATDIIEMYNWNQSNSANASKVVYDNSTSKIPATTMQGAIDSLASTIYGNRLINGSMRIAQRGTSGTVTPGIPAYTLDRWILDAGGSGALPWSAAVASSIGAPVHYMAVNGVAGSTGFSIKQRIEARNCVGLIGKKVTVSFVVYGNTAGVTVTPVLNCASASDNFSSLVNGIVGSAFAVPSNSTWSQQLSYTFNLTSNNVLNGIELTFTVSSLTSASNMFAISEVQFEVGERATPFVYSSMQQELALCQRYYQDWSNSISLVTDAGIMNVNRLYFSAMRIAPVITQTSGGTGGSWRAANNMVLFQATVNSSNSVTSVLELNAEL